MSRYTKEIENAKASSLQLDSLVRRRRLDERNGTTGWLPWSGAAYAKQYCSKCHAISDTEISPEPKAPRFKDIANKRSAAVLDVWLRRPHLYMPNIVVEADQIDNVIAYILSLKKSQ
jgi:mono/diheme cytochrome c family protein